MNAPQLLIKTLDMLLKAYKDLLSSDYETLNNPPEKLFVADKYIMEAERVLKIMKRKYAAPGTIRFGNKNRTVRQNVRNNTGTMIGMKIEDYK